MPKGDTIMFRKMIRNVILKSVSENDIELFATLSRILDIKVRFAGTAYATNEV